MKRIVVLALIIISNNAFSQTENQIDSLSFAHIKIAVPENYQAKSEYELLDYDGISIQWLYSNKEMLEPMASQVIGHFSNKKTTKKQTELKVESFGSELKGYKFKIKNSNGISYRIIVYGTVNNQPLILNIRTTSDINETDDLNEFLKTIIKIK